MINKSIFLAVTTFILSFNVSAAYIDHGVYITDTESGLDWIKWSETAGKSLDQVLAETGPGGLYEGWEMASSFQIWSVSDANEFYFSVVNPLPLEERYWYNFNSLGSFSAERAFNLDLLDTVYDSNGVVLDALYETSTAQLYCIDPPNPTNGKTGACSLQYFDSNVEWSSTTSSELSTALIRPSTTIVPVPAALWLFGSGFLVLLGLARSKNHYHSFIKT
ncbi:MAG: hypothetical protein OEY89_06460 [Gammaproteobacteria bacterium]|nr:hypothetical protein [Gammaproteobacteria bacterium]